MCFGSLEFWRGKLFTLIFASGVSLTYNGFEISSLGIPWFFFALFLGRSIFDYVHLAMKEEPKVILCCSLIGMIGVLYGQIQWLPFSLDIALAVMPLFYFGYFRKKFTLYALCSHYGQLLAEIVGRKSTVLFRYKESSNWYTDISIYYVCQKNLQGLKK